MSCICWLLRRTDFEFWTYTLFRYIAAEQIPVKYGGLSIDGEFGTTDAVTEVTVKPANTHTVEFPVTEVSFLYLYLKPKNSSI